MDLVTGASGFLGGRVVAALTGRQQEVRVLVRRTSEAEHLLRPTVEQFNGDLGDVDSLEAALEGVTRVFHCAALVSDWGRRQDFHAANVDGVRNLLEQSVRAGVERFVHVSSSDVYGFPDYPVEEPTPFKKRGFSYGDSKIEGEELVWKFIRQHDFPATIVRPASIYGPGSITLVKDITDLLLSGDMVFVGRGDKRAGLAYVSNVADLMLLAAEDDASIGQAYNATDGAGVTWEQYVGKLAELVGAPIPRTHIPYPIAYSAGWCMERFYALRGWPSRPLITRTATSLLGTDQEFPNDKARRELGFVPAVDFDEGMQRVAAWLEQVYETKSSGSL